MSKNPLMYINSRQRTVLSYIVEVLTMGALTLLSGFRLFPYISIPLGILLLYKILHHRAGLIPQNIASINLMLKLLYEMLSFKEEDDVRCTLLIPKTRERYLVQLSRYTPSGKGVSKSIIPFGKGVGGQCFDQNKTMLEKIDPGIGFIDFMTQRGFTQEEAQQFLSDRKSYLCVPITGQDGSELGVLSLDSKEYATFDENMGIVITDLFVPVYSVYLGKENHSV